MGKLMGNGRIGQFMENGANNKENGAKVGNETINRVVRQLMGNGANIGGVNKKMELIM